MEKLEPTEARRKAMAAAAASSRAQAWSDRIDDWLPIVDEMFAAADRIPEGAPVGTIKIKDGWPARMCMDSHGNHVWVGMILPPWNRNGTYDALDADSWPVIYDPTKPETLEELRTEVDRLDKAEDRALTERDELQETVNRILYTCSSVDEIGEWSSANDPVERFIEQFKPVKRIDPTAQQEPERFPGIENPTIADHVGADNADEQLKLIFGLRDIRIERGLSVAFVGEALCLEDAEVERFESGSMNPTMSLIRRYARAVEAVFTVEVRKWEDTQPQREPALRERFPEQASAYVADPELAEVDDEPLPSGSLITPNPPRTPRVVDRLGVDEQGSRWRDVIGDVWNWDERGWHCVAKYGPTSPVPYLAGETALHGPFKEILEPRELDEESN
ncbi:helix-turn-helix domain-containing protein [Mycobacteroides abscessus]|uniref:helix-turn-helix domain-containing protein n=1 Tax=Mycobacteroides abscessus TaxID=36809 RepID=UPI001F188E2C|nr:helix-turn-helix transcriptional regulator [Mycobacteroides abscessus]